MKNMLDGLNKVGQEVDKECLRQREKWGVKYHSPIEWIAILTEEVGEAAKEAVQLCLDKREKSLGNYRKELLQVAAVAVSAIECLERQKGERHGSRSN